MNWARTRVIAPYWMAVACVNSSQGKLYLSNNRDTAAKARNQKTQLEQSLCVFSYISPINLAKCWDGYRAASHLHDPLFGGKINLLPLYVSVINR